MREIEYYDLPDETLVNLALLGQNHAFEELVIRFQNAVKISAYSVTRNASLAEDVIQDAFVSAWMKLNTLKEPHKFGAWICNIAKNKAKNLVVKHQKYVSFDLLENVAMEQSENLEDVFFSEKDDYNSLHSAIGGLSGKLKEVIYLHYFENASIDEISLRLNLPAGTVKWRLHEGREKIRKGLGYMESSTKKTAESVLEKIGKVKAWHARDNKDGFEADYKNAVTAIEAMPDTKEKYFNLAEVMQLGYWWLPGEKNDELVEKIRQAAQKGGNNIVLGEIWKREADKYHDGEKTAYILNTLIPRMENAGMKEAAGKEWFWLGCGYHESNNKEAGYAAYKKVMEILPKHHEYYACALAAIRSEKLFEKLENPDMLRLSSKARGEQYLLDGGRLYYYKQNACQRGNMYGGEFAYAFYSASRCDGIFYDAGLKAGESVKSHDGKTELTFVSENNETETPCGKFYGCQLWVTKTTGYKASVYYKRGIGIVFTEVDEMGRKSCCALKKYHIAGGEGLIPFCEGNTWEYDGGFDPEYCDFEHVFEVVSFNGSEVIAASRGFLYRKAYSPDKWEDMILQMRREYHDGNSGLRDVSAPMERAAALARTPYQKAHTAAAADTMKRILEGSRDFTPDGKFDGHWNFFNSGTAYAKDGKITVPHNFIYSFEWKQMGIGDAGEPLLGNDILGIIDDVTGGIWYDKWQDGAAMTLKSVDWMNTATNVTIEHLDSIEVAAGRFEDCLKVNLDIKSDGVSSGLVYRTGKKEYYYAKNIGIVKCVHHFKNDAVVADYELTSYEKTGEGYMPLSDGLVRTYEAMGLTKGFIGRAEYTFCEDDGVIKVIQNKTGIRDTKAELYSAESWEDTMMKMRREVYREDKEKGWILPDISALTERANALAATDYQKKHAAAAIDVAKRMKDGDSRFTPENKFESTWNTFVYKSIDFNDGKTISETDWNYSFAWHCYGNSGDIGYYLIANDLLGILKDAAGCIWDEKWQPGASMKTKGAEWPNAFADTAVEKAGEIKTAAGKFDDVIKITFDVTVPHKTEPCSEVGFFWPQLASRAGKKEYYFAKGIGIVKCVNYLKNGEITANYELTAYEGTGDGYMPVKNGLTRLYEAIGLTDGYVGKTEYTFCEKNGGIIILENRTGIKVLTSINKEG